MSAGVVWGSRREDEVMDALDGVRRQLDRLARKLEGACGREGEREPESGLRLLEELRDLLRNAAREVPREHDAAAIRDELHTIREQLDHLIGALKRRLVPPRGDEGMRRALQLLEDLTIEIGGGRACGCGIEAERSRGAGRPYRVPRPPYPPYPPHPPFPAFPPFPPYLPHSAPPPAPGPIGASAGQAPAAEPPVATEPSSGPAPAPGDGTVIGPFGLTSIHLDGIAGCHRGVGTWDTTKAAVDPASVPGSGPLQFKPLHMRTTTKLYALGDPGLVPDWFGVAFRPDLADFTKLNLFFHPIPHQAKYEDEDYPSKSGAHGTDWRCLFHYMERLGYQLDGAHRDQVIVMPFLTSAAAADVGLLPAHWLSICTAILTDVRAGLGKDTGSPIALSEVVVSSFSNGMQYSSAFRKAADDLISPKPLLTAVWDFDGFASSATAHSQSLVATAQFGVVKYDTHHETQSNHVPQGRWVDFPDPPVHPPAPAPPNQPPLPYEDYPKNRLLTDIHHAIVNYLFLHAATQ